MPVAELEAQLNVQSEQRINLVREVTRTEKLYQEKQLPNSNTMKYWDS